jgi:hypothetical protein
MDNMGTVHGVADMFAKDNGSPKSGHVFRPVCTTAFLTCHSQKSLKTGKCYFRFVRKTSKTNNNRYVLQERITFEITQFDLNHDSRNVSYI